MVNVHNPRQCFVTKNWSRYLSLYQLGFGSDRGIGFRDSAQDIMGVMAHMPAQAAELAQKLLSVQRRDGSAMHQFNPLTMIASEGDSRERDDRPHYYSDDHLWIVLAVCAYLKETGDLGFLRKEVPFYDKDERGRTTTAEKAPVLEHLRAAAAFTRGDLGRARPAAPRLRRLERHGQPADGRRERLHRLPLRRGPPRAGRPRRRPGRRRVGRDAGGPGTPR